MYQLPTLAAVLKCGRMLYLRTHHYSTVIAACDRGGAWDICLWMLEEAREERTEGANANANAKATAKANVFAYTAAISACGKAGHWEEAVSLLDVRDDGWAVSVCVGPSKV